MNKVILDIYLAKPNHQRRLHQKQNNQYCKIYNSVQYLTVDVNSLHQKTFPGNQHHFLENNMMTEEWFFLEMVS
jgi:hypothetical protein